MTQINRVRLAVFDLDGTLVRGETICETIARPLGRLERMREMETLSAIDVAGVTAGRQEMAEWYRPFDFAALCSHLEVCQLAPGVNEGFQLLQDHGITTAITSITWEFAVEWFARQLGVEHYVGTRLSSDGLIAHFWPQDKESWTRRLAQQLGTDMEHVAAIGDSRSDAYMLEAVGHPIYVGAEMPNELDGVIHMPHRNINEVAQFILGSTA